jgi:hypothetical protein
MADIRIKDLATTATTTASDDFMAVDGSTNGTRKMNAAAPAFLTSVTTPSLTSPASTALTLAGGSSGASISLGQGANAGMSITPSGTGAVNLINSVNVNGVTGVGKLAVRTGTDENAHFRTATAIGGTGVGLDMLNDANSAVVGFALRASATRLTGGVVSITDTTAGSAGAGALVVTGGLSAGGASYFGGAVTVASTISSTGKTTVTSGNIRLSNAYYLSGNLAAGTEITMIGRRSDDKIAIDPDGYGVVFGGGAATFAGAVSAPSLTLSTTPLAFASGGTGAASSGQALAKLTNIATTVTSGTTVVLTNTSANYQVFTGSTVQTVQLPVTSTLETGWSFSICNNSSAVINIQTSAGTALYSNVPIGTTAAVRCIATGGTGVGDWEANLTEFSTNSGTGSVVLNGNPSLTAFTCTGNATIQGNANFTGAVGSTHIIGSSLVGGTVTIGGTGTTGAITLGQSTATHTLSIDAGATASGSTKTLNIGTGGAAGSTTAIAIGSTDGTSTTTINGALKLGNAYVVGAVVGTGTITIQDSTGTTYRIPVLV